MAPKPPETQVEVGGAPKSPAATAEEFAAMTGVKPGEQALGVAVTPDAVAEHRAEQTDAESPEDDGESAVDKNRKAVKGLEDLNAQPDYGGHLVAEVRFEDGHKLLVFKRGADGISSYGMGEEEGAVYVSPRFGEVIFNNDKAAREGKTSLSADALLRRWKGPGASEDWSQKETYIKPLREGEIPIWQAAYEQAKEVAKAAVEAARERERMKVAKMALDIINADSDVGIAHAEPVLSFEDGGLKAERAEEVQAPNPSVR